MANGTHDINIARSDRIREQSEKDQRAAELNRRATLNAIAELRGQELPPYRAEMDSEVTITTGPLKAGVKGAPRFALGVAIVLIAAAAALIAVLRFGGR